MAATFTPGTDIHKIRTLIGDGDIADPDFTDEELGVFLDLSTGNVIEAAAKAYEAIARTVGRLAKRVKIGGYETEQRAVDELLFNAQRLRESDLTGTLTVGSIIQSGEHFDAYSGGWTDVNDPCDPVRE